MGSVLLVDDEPGITRATGRILSQHGHTIAAADSGREALEKARATAFDVIVSDLSMPDMDGRTLLREIRAASLDVPVVFMTGNPDLRSAIEAVESGAFRYLVKPVAAADLLDVVTQAVSWHRLAVVRREIAQELSGQKIENRAALEVRFAAALDSLWIATQPVVTSDLRSMLGYEVLVRTNEPSLRNPRDLFDVAEKLHQSQTLGRRIRRLVANIVPTAPASTLILVNLHPNDLQDDELASRDGALTPFATRVVLEITERAALDGIPNLSARIRRLRDLGFRTAVDDLGTGYASLSSFASIEPDLVKADISLIRGIETSALKQRLVRAIVALAEELRVQVVAEGVETTAERTCVSDLGVHAMQGHLFGRPSRGFPPGPHLAAIPTASRERLDPALYQR
jgi:EAL domain-containing protein (putative c-di-GMP-specific phosphodiesterase class I)